MPTPRLTRRQVATSTAWAAPSLVMAANAPAVAASSPPSTNTVCSFQYQGDQSTQGTFTVLPDRSGIEYSVTFAPFQLTSVLADNPDIVSFSLDLQGAVALDVAAATSSPDLSLSDSNPTVTVSPTGITPINTPVTITVTGTARSTRTGPDGPEPIPDGQQSGTLCDANYPGIHLRSPYTEYLGRPVLFLYGADGKNYQSGDGFFHLFATCGDPLRAVFFCGGE